MLECQTKDMFFFICCKTDQHEMITIAITIYEYRDPENPLNSILTQSIFSIFDISATKIL